MEMTHQGSGKGGGLESKRRTSGPMDVVEMDSRTCVFVDGKGGGRSEEDLMV